MQKLLQVLHGALPKMSLIASDFSYLPDVRIPGERAPLVASKVQEMLCCFFMTCLSTSLNALKLFIFFLSIV